MNKCRYFFVLLSLGFLSLAQEKDSLKDRKIIQNKISGLTTVPAHQYSMDDKSPKVIYPGKQEMLGEIDGRMMDVNSFRSINPNNIESIQHGKIRGERAIECLVIKTKRHANQNIITLRELIIKYYEKLPERLIFSVDNELINEAPENILVDEKYIMKIEISSLGKVNIDETIYFKLSTRTTKNVQEANTVYIR